MEVTLKGNKINLSGNLPKPTNSCPNFSLVTESLDTVDLSNYEGMKVILNIFPSCDTGVCAGTIHNFYKKCHDIEGLIVLNISKDLPFAQSRFKKENKLQDATILSAYRSSFSKDFGIEMLDGPLQELCARAVICLDETGKIIYTELVPEIGQEPDYDKALNAMGLSKS